MDDLLSNLSTSELERIMAVLNRDKKLRERERERVIKLGIELVREKRQGALVVNDKQKQNMMSRCARCLSLLPAVARLNKAKWRCCVCKHLICKSCRVIKKYPLESGGEANFEDVHDACYMPRDANSFSQNENHDADVSSSTSEAELGVLRESFTPIASPLEESYRDLWEKNKINEPEGASIRSFFNDESNKLAWSSLTKSFPPEQKSNSTENFEIDSNCKIIDEDQPSTAAVAARPTAPPRSGLVQSMSGHTSVATLNLEKQQSKASLSNSPEDQKMVMKRFLAMAGVQVSAKSEDISQKFSASKSVSSPPKKWLEKQFLTSTPLKALTIFSHSPLEVASKLFNSHSASESEELPSLIRTTLIGSNKILDKVDPEASNHSKELPGNYERQSVRSMETNFEPTTPTTEPQTTSAAALMHMALAEFSTQHGLPLYAADFKRNFITGQSELSSESDVTADEVVGDLESEASSPEMLCHNPPFGPFLPLLKKTRKKNRTLNERKLARKKRRDKTRKKRKQAMFEPQLTDQEKFHSTGEVESQTLENGTCDRTRSTSLVNIGRATSVFLTTVSGLRKNLIEKETVFWVCRVCHKTFDLRKKTGDWFHTATNPAAITYKQTLFSASSRSLSSTMGDSRNRSPSTLSIASYSLLRHNSAEAISRSPDDTNSPSRPRSQTLQPHMTADFSIMPSSKLSRRTISEAVLANLRKYVEEPSSDEAVPRTKITTATNGAQPAIIKMGLKNCSVMRGFPISLGCVFVGTPPVQVTWKKERNEIRDCAACNIETTHRMSAMTIPVSELGDCGSYTVRVANSTGMDHSSCNVQVVDVPLTPSKPIASMIPGKGISLKWINGEENQQHSITEYIVEATEVGGVFDKKCTTNSLERSNNDQSKLVPVQKRKAESGILIQVMIVKLLNQHVVRSDTWVPTNGSPPCWWWDYQVTSRNRYGLSRPSPGSKPVQYIATLEHYEVKNEEDEKKNQRNVVVTNEELSQHYDVKERLATGHLGDWFRVVHRRTGEQGAAKLMSKLKTKEREFAERRIDVLKQLCHKNIMQIVDAYQVDRRVAIVTELIVGPRLHEMIVNDNCRLTELLCANIIRQICSGLAHIHEKSIAHLNLEPRNILCIAGNVTRIKLIGFGAARDLKRHDDMRVVKRSAEYTAPELMDRDKITCQADMWSVGVICYVMLSGISPFWGGNEEMTSSKVDLGTWQFDDGAFQGSSDEAKQFITNLLVKNPMKRLKASVVGENSWLKVTKEGAELDRTRLQATIARYRQNLQNYGVSSQAIGKAPLQSHLFFSSSPRAGESRFLATIRDQFLRGEKKEQNVEKPEFIETCDDVEATEGGEAQFRCVIVGRPEPEVTWLKDNLPIKESSRFRISYNQKGEATLFISEISQADEAEYSCRGMNPGGEVIHRAELIVVSAGL